jgi:hypothetical protein
VLDEADGLLKQGYEGFINRVHAQIPKITSDGKRLQVGLMDFFMLIITVTYESSLMCSFQSIVPMLSRAIVYC